MEIQLVEHTVPKKTPFGTVQRSLNQHRVFIRNDEGRLQHCGYVGVHAFLPLSGFPVELCGPVTSECERQLGRKLASVEPPPSMAKLAEMANESNSDDE